MIRLKHMGGIVLIFLAIILAGCGGSEVSVSENVGNSNAGISTIPQVQHVAVLVLENMNYSDVVGSSNAPYLNSLLSKGSLASRYYANAHPSIPNYFMMTTGEAVTNDDGFSDTVSIDNVVRELNSANKSWKVYAESLPSPGYLGGDTGLYLRRHNPFVFFTDVQQSPAQAANIVPFTQLSADIGAGALPNYSFIIPNALDDAHSCSDGSTTSCTVGSRLATADAWIHSNIAPLLSSPAFQSSGLLAVVFDESGTDFTNGGGQVFMLMIGTHAKAGYMGTTTTYDHRSLLSLTLKAAGVSSIPNGADAAPQMGEFFQ